MRAMKTTLAVALAACCAILSVEGTHHLKGLKAGAALAAIGAGLASQVAPGIVAAGLWAPPQNHHDHHGWESHGHGGGGGGGGYGGYGHGHGHGGDYKHGIGHGHGHGYNEFGWASLPSPVVNLGPLLRHASLKPIHDVLPRINVALPQHHGLQNDHGW